jgi:enterochelin esterase-like enzyme
VPYPGLTERTLRCRSGVFERTVWSLAPPAGQPTAAILFLDGELYLERVGAAVVVRRLLERRAIPPAAAVFLSHGGAAARHEDFVCRPEYARFIAHDLVGAVREEHQGLTEVVIAGLSLSGLAAAYVATRHPAVFRAAVCQSPSFWWEGGRFAEELPPAPQAGPEFWICVGSRETQAGVSHLPSGLEQGLTQIAGCLVAVAALRAKGYGVSYREYDGGHDPGCWRDDLSLALPWALRRDDQLPAVLLPAGLE